MSTISDSSRTTGASVAVVDYGLGNLRSVSKGLQRAGADVIVTDDRESLWDVDGVVLPGVGAFGAGVKNAEGLREDLREIAATDTPLFGICLGMQLLLTTSEEADHAGQGEVRGLDVIPGDNVRFRGDLTVPHMGWNQLSVNRAHPLLEAIDGEYAYFVHSYYAVPTNESAIVATTDYGDAFASVIADETGTVFGTQFHPEKSGETGLQILRNFVDICRNGD